MDKTVCITSQCDAYQPQYNGFLSACRLCNKEIIRVKSCPKNIHSH
jgi:hypothetical protein